MKCINLSHENTLSAPSRTPFCYGGFVTHGTGKHATQHGIQHSSYRSRHLPFCSKALGFGTCATVLHCPFQRMSPTRTSPGSPFQTQSIPSLPCKLMMVPGYLMHCALHVRHTADSNAPHFKMFTGPLFPHVTPPRARSSSLPLTPPLARCSGCRRRCRAPGGDGPPPTGRPR